MRFSQKIVTASSLLLFVTVSVLSLHQIYTLDDEIQGVVDTSLKELVESTRDTVDAQIEGRKALAQATTEQLAFMPNNREHIKRVLESPKMKSEFLAIGYAFDSDGSMIENDDGWTPGADYDPRTRPWFKGPKNARKLTVTAPYLDMASKKIIVSIGTPVYQDGQFVAGMFYDIELSGLAELINNVNLLNAGNLLLMTADGTTIAHPDTEKNGTKLDTYLPGLNIQPGMQSYELEGKEYLVFFAKLSTEDWYVGALVDPDIAFAAVDHMAINSLIYGVVGIVISLILLGVLIKYLMGPLRALNSAIQDVASGQGDLTKRLNTNTDKEFAELADGFNRFSETLQKQISQSKEIGAEILRGTEMTVAGAQESAHAMRSQLMELEQLATAMHEMSVTASDVANNAQSAAAAAKEAEEATNEGSNVVSDTTESINALSARIDQAVEEVQGLESATANIETILEVINDIADQTNLLALNAAIEAARAGESGRGFAVVADEVRTLASRTQQSTTEIRTMIEQLQSGAKSVSDAMTESKHTAVSAVDNSQAANIALERIGSAIMRITEMNTQIAAAAEQQSLVAEEINTNTVKIKDLSTQVAETTENSSIAMQAQTENVREQDAVLNKFIV
ncbi:methyl-accepting chemotaxis protein [Vibrio olivae]|uniref:Methyl-accepting chemotaxis protein n=1 Tax=Vibrio olivae TaxID=1243002 RepID=A0ABV5HLD4_9VIBR